MIPKEKCESIGFHHHLCLRVYFKREECTASMGENECLTVTVIGTCRVHDTLAQVEKEGLVQINNGGMSTFVHSLPEVLMRLKVFGCDATYSSDIVDLQVGVRKGVSLEPNKEFKFEETDVVVIEISTLKSIFFEKQPLQFNEVNRLLCTPHGEFGIELRANINHAFNNDESSISVPKLPFPNTLSENHRRIISKLRPKLMGEEDIVSCLNLIHEYAKKPILFVNHINVEGVNGKKITSRNKLCRIIEKYCAQHDFALFEPSTLFADHERKTLLAKDGEDLAHYAKSGLRIVGMEQYKLILQLIQSSV